MDGLEITLAMLVGVCFAASVQGRPFWFVLEKAHGLDILKKVVVVSIS